MKTKTKKTATVAVAVELRLMTPVQLESAHSVRWLRVCALCSDGGSLTEDEHREERARRREALFLHVHAACYLKQFGEAAFFALPRAEMGKLTVNEFWSPLTGKTKEAQRAFLDRFNVARERAR